MREHDGLGLLGDRTLELGDVHVVAMNGHINEHRHGTILENRVDGGRESGGNGDHLIPWTNRPVTQLR